MMKKRDRSRPKTLFLSVALFLFSAVYALAMDNLAKSQAPDLTWPLILNGVAPCGVLLWLGKRGLKRIDDTFNELIKEKNAHAERIKGIETIHRTRGCDQPDPRERRPAGRGR